MRRVDRVFKEMETPEQAATKAGGKRRSRYVLDVWHKSGGASGGTSLPRGPAPVVRRLYGAVQRLQTEQKQPVRSIPPSFATAVKYSRTVERGVGAWGRRGVARNWTRCRRGDHNR